MNQFRKSGMLASMAIFSAVIACGSIMYAPVVSAQENSLSAQSNESNERDELVDELINKLGASSFAERQVAAERLWQLGAPIKIRLQARQRTSDLEVSKRIRGILEAFELGMDSKTTYSTALMRIYFKEGDRVSRNQILSSLRGQEEFGLLFELLESEKTMTQQARLFRDNVKVARLILSLASQEKWEQIEMILEHPISWKYEFQLCGYWAHLNGRLDKYVDSLKADVDKRFSEFPHRTDEELEQKKFVDKDGKKKEPSEEETAELNRRLSFESDLLRLVRLFRVSGRHAEAIQYANIIEKKVTRFEFVNRLLMEKGDWKTISEKMYDRENTEPAPEPEEGRIPCNPGQLALVSLLAGDSVGYEKYRSDIEKKAQPGAKKSEAGKSDSDQIPDEENPGGMEEQPDDAAIALNKRLLTDLYILDLDWENAVQQIEVKSENRKEMFQLLVYLNRLDDAFKLYDLNDSVSQRMIWLNRLEQRINSIYKKYLRVETNAVNKKLIKVFDEGLMIALQLGSLGFEDEAVLHLRTLADLTENKKFKPTRAKIVAALVRLERFDETWQLIEDRFDRDSVFSLSSELFPEKSSVAQFFMAALSDAYPDHLERLKHVAFIVNSPMQKPTEANRSVEHYFSQVLANESQTSTTTYLNFAKVMQYHGRHELHLQYLEQASHLQNQEAANQRGTYAFVSGDFETAARYFDSVGGQAVRPLAAMSAAKSFGKMNDDLNRRRRELIAFASWLNSYGTDRIVKEFQDKKLDSWMTDCLRYSVYLSKSNQNTNENYRVSIAKALEERDPDEAWRHWQIFLFDQFGKSSRGTNLNWATLVRRVRLSEARAKLQTGQFEKALELSMRLANFRRGDSDFGEKLVAEFKAQSQPERAAKLFSNLAKFYEDTLVTYPESPLHNNNYAWLCATSGRRYGAAEFHSELALSRRQYNPSYLDTRAEVNFLMGEREKAIELEGKCLRINPSKRSYLEKYFRFGGK